MLSDCVEKLEALVLNSIDDDNDDEDDCDEAFDFARRSNAQTIIDFFRSKQCETLARIDFSYCLNLDDSLLEELYEALSARTFQRLEVILLHGCANDNLTAEGLVLLASVASDVVYQIKISGFDPFVILKLYSKSQL